MDICEIMNKGPVVKNKKTTLILKDYWDVVLPSIRECKDKVRNIQDDGDFFDLQNRRSLLVRISELQSVIESCVLGHRTANIVTEPLEATVTYDQFELLYNIISEKICELEDMIRRFGTIFLKDESELYMKMSFIRNESLKDIDVIVKKLYPAREKTEKVIKDYIDECSYSEEFLETDKEITLHIHSCEKSDILLSIDNTIYNIREGFIHGLDMKVDDDVIFIQGKEADGILEKISHQITSSYNSISDGCRFKVNLKEYFVLMSCIDFATRSRID